MEYNILKDCLERIAHEEMKKRNADREQRTRDQVAQARETEVYTDLIFSIFDNQSG